MKEVLLGGAAGLALGMGMQRLKLHRREDLRCAVGLLNPGMLRALLTSLGAGTILAAFLMWLAVIDVDTVVVPPLNGGTVLGGALFGAALGWSGITPATSGAVLGADRLLEGLCAVAGCVAGTLLLPWAEPAFAAVQGWLDGGAATFFRVTLDEPFWFAGDFLGQGCVGLALLAVGLCVRRAREEPAPEEPVSAPDASAQPQEVQEETFVAILPGEEPVVVDTAEEENEE